MATSTTSITTCGGQTSDARMLTSVLQQQVYQLLMMERCTARIKLILLGKSATAELRPAAVAPARLRGRLIWLCSPGLRTAGGTAAVESENDFTNDTRADLQESEEGSRELIELVFAGLGRVDQ
jgi:hypothetical protein